MPFIPIPPKIRKEIDADPFYKVCSLYCQTDHDCAGRITMEHAIEYAGKRLQTKWAIIPLCAQGHEVDNFQDAGTMNKEKNIWVALNRATEIELRAISKAVDYTRERERLNKKYGMYIPKVPEAKDIPTRQPLSAEPKQNWYLISHRDKYMIEKMRLFHKEALGSSRLPREIITGAIESAFLEIRDQLVEQDEELYKKLGFDK